MRLDERVWRGIKGPAQWWAIWFAHSKFNAGCHGLVRDDRGRVLLVRNRMWPIGKQWGAPGGYANSGEVFSDAVAREVFEETGYQVQAAAEPVHVKSGYRLRIELWYTAEHVGGELKLDPKEVLDGFRIHRNQHGINFRRENGRTYSARDARGSPSTRNLGVIMEGAIDREATALARATASTAKVPCPPGGIDLYAFRDGTGATIAAPESSQPWLTSMNADARSVTTPYAGFLAEIAGPDETELHELIVRAILTGDLGTVQTWLARRYGPGEFTALFRSSDYAPA